MSDASREYQRAELALIQGNISEALSGSLMALALNPGKSAHRAMAMKLLGMTGGYPTLPGPVLDGLVRCIDDPDLDLQPLALVVRNLLDANPLRDQWLELSQSSDFGSTELAIKDDIFDSLFNDRLVRAVLTQATNVSLDLEHILTGLRHHALRAATHGKVSLLTSRYSEFHSALTIQAERTEYVWGETEEETGWLACINIEADNDLIMRAFRPTKMSAPMTFPNLTRVTDTTSLKIQDQYTTYPYPRWERISTIQPQTLENLLRRRFPKQIWPERFKGSVFGLSAGCGTGLGAAMLSQSIKNLSLTAIDLSPTSLAFAKTKTDYFGIHSIKFGLGDILELGKMNGRFDIVECSGVIHHMARPEKGLEALRTCVESDGVLRIALYSKRARKAVVAAKLLIKERGIPDSLAGLRRARLEINTLPMDHPARGVIDTPEFFTLSGLHDLVFNVHEQHFTPKDLKCLLECVGLQFIGFDHVDPTVMVRYQIEFPGDPEQTNLDNWEVFEQKHPETFNEMYQIWCRPVTYSP